MTARCDTDECAEHHCNCRRHTPIPGHTCPTCVGRTRDDLTNIHNHLAAMPHEATHRGVTSEAANQTGPATNPESWSWRKITAAKAGVPWAELPDDDQTHAQTVLWEWEWLARETLDQPTDLAWTVSRCVDYLTGRLTVLSRHDGFAFTEFSKAVRKIRAHLEAVLRDQGHGDVAGVGCFDCGGDLERRLTARSGFEDVWTCKGCRRQYKWREYMFAVRAALEGRTTTDA